MGVPHAAFARHPRLAWGLLCLVLGLHALLAWRLDESRLGEGDRDGPPKAMDIAFVKELMPTTPPSRAAAAPRPPAPAPTWVATPEPTASAPQAKPPESAVPTDPAPTDLAAASPAEVASAPASAEVPPIVGTAASATVPPFEWPPSTKLAYTLKGDFRGPLEGTATVDWLRRGDRYQVRVEVHTALVFTRKMLSEGTLGPQGLQPQRYDEVTEVVLGNNRQQTMRFEPSQVELANGQRVAAPLDVQDTASQLVQMTWRFTTQPELLTAGNTILVPLALPKRVGLWTYDVGLPETLALPFGPVDAVHLTPRSDSSRPDEITMDIWVAPTLQYLPVRIRFEQRRQGFAAELTLASRPKQADDAVPAAAR